MKKIIKPQELEQYGVMQQHEIMENGEIRFRLIGPDGSSYIRCESGSDCVWENSHCHSRLKEMILVQKGRIVFVEYIEGRTRFQKLEADDFVITTPMIPHNICMFSHTVVHTIKFGDCGNADWIPSKQLDEATKGLSFAEASERAFTQ